MSKSALRLLQILHPSPVIPILEATPPSARCRPWLPAASSSARGTWLCCPSPCPQPCSGQPICSRKSPMNHSPGGITPLEARHAQQPRYLAAVWPRPAPVLEPRAANIQRHGVTPRGYGRLPVDLQLAYLPRRHIRREAAVGILQRVAEVLAVNAQLADGVTLPLSCPSYCQFHSPPPFRLSPAHLEDEIEFARRCARKASHRLGIQKKSGMKRK